MDGSNVAGKEDEPPHRKGTERAIATKYGERKAAHVFSVFP
jgi:hypothetical protein